MAVDEKTTWKSYMAQLDHVAPNLRDYGQPTSFWWAQRGGPDGNSGNPKKKKKGGSEPIIYSILFCIYLKGEVRKKNLNKGSSWAMAHHWLCPWSHPKVGVL
jgi:hypothetical protein